MQLPELLYRVVGSLDGRPVEQIAAELNAEFADQLDEEVTPEDVTAVIDGQLRPVGIIAPDPSEVAPGTGQQPVAAPVRADPLLALRYRIGVVPASVALRVSRILGPLFARPVWVVLLAAFVAVDVAILLPGDLVGRATAGVQDMIRMPVLVLAALALTVVASAFHEWGHITACRYGGATPGDVGVGLYIVWPAFYSTVTDSYRLDRRGRLRTDLGGVYFDAVLLAVLGLVYLRTGQPWLLVALIGLHVETAWQFLPSIRLDGYYILADLIGVPDLFGYVRAGLLSLVPGRPVPAKIAALKPRARRLVVLWVALVVPTLAAGAAAFLVALPRVVPAVVHSVAAYLDRLGGAARAGDVVVTTIGVIQLGLVLLPWIGTLLLLGSAGAAGCRWVAARSRIAPVPAVVRRAAVYAGALTALLAVGTALVARVLQVAETHPASAGELRLIDGAVAELHGVAPPPAAGLGDALARAELVGYARLAHPFARHADVVAAAREPAVVAVAVLVAALLALVVVGQLRPVAVAVPLLAVAATGPAVTALATAGPTLLGVACTALGATVVGPPPGRGGGGRGGGRRPPPPPRAGYADTGFPCGRRRSIRRPTAAQRTSAPPATPDQRQRCVPLDDGGGWAGRPSFRTSDLLAVNHPPCVN
jgi:putative peptide zinc metalloprotease protein